MVNLMYLKKEAAMIITKNNWIDSNLPERYTNPQADFQLTFNMYPFKEMSFESAIEMTVKEIASKYSNFYIALSGGYDSECVLRAFHRHNIPMTPIIVCVGDDYPERRFAYKACNDLGIIPVVIKPTDEEFIEYFYNKIFKKFNSYGWNATQVMIAAEYAEQHNGTLITGGHFIGDEHTNLADDWVTTFEWDFYTGYVYPAVNKIDFYLYTMELMWSMFPNHQEGNWSGYKQKLFGLEYREKTRARYSEYVKTRLREILGKKEDYTHGTEHRWTKEEFEGIIRPALIKES